MKCSLLPSLTELNFEGVTEYLEELVTRIDTPRLGRMDVTLVNQIDTPRLAQFTNRTSLAGRAGGKARVEFCRGMISVHLQARVNMSIFSTEPDRQLSSVAQVCNLWRSLSTVEALNIESRIWQPVWMGDASKKWLDGAVKNTLWLQVLLHFTAVKNLYLSKVFAPSIAATLQELVEGRIIEVLPSLQNIFVEGLESSVVFQEKIGQFIAARQFSGHSISISVWDK